MGDVSEAWGSSPPWPAAGGEVSDASEVPVRPARSLPPLVTERLREVVAADAGARAWLYDTFAPRLYRRLVARYAGRPGLDPDDLFQDAFVFFFQHDARVLRRFLDEVPAAEQTVSRLDGHLWNLACGIASNRSRSWRRHPELALPAEPAPRDPGLAERSQVSRDVLVRLAACLRRSGSRVWLYCTLRFVDGLSPAEVATATGWSRKATYKLKLALNDAVQRCAARLRLR